MLASARFKNQHQSDKLKSLQSCMCISSGNQSCIVMMTTMKKMKKQIIDLQKAQAARDSATAKNQMIESAAAMYSQQKALERVTSQLKVWMMVGVVSVVCSCKDTDSGTDII